MYLNIDVAGLADVIQYYREITMKTYGLDPCHFIGTPGLTWTAGLKYTGVKLQNIKDPDMYMMLEMGKRGGMSVISHRYAKANNQYLPNFDNTKLESYLMQLDVNNLYGYAMKQYLPVDSFKWADENLSIQELIKINEQTNNSTGFIVEVDRTYPESLHDEHNDYPLAPEHKTINKTKKLVPNLLNKTKYVCHLSNLKYYMTKGLIVTKLHKALQFRQEPWLAGYIDKNTQLRQNAKNDFEKDYFKLMNNAFFGKTMEEKRNHIDIKFCLDEKQFTKHTGSALFANNITALKNDVFLVQKHKKTIVLDKPIYVGVAILELSKLLMYELFYDVLRVQFPQCRMLKTDTDSLLIEVFTKDLYADLKNSDIIQKHMEFSNYPIDHPLYN